jgi:hypothetical protein
MRYTTNALEIQNILTGRTALEQKLALGLSEIFSSGNLYDRINEAVKASFQALLNLQHKPGTKDKISATEKEQAFLFSGKIPNKTVQGICDYYSSPVNKLTPEECGSLIRFYGEIVDACASFSIYWKEERMKQISWRYGGGGETFKTSRSIQDFKDRKLGRDNKPPNEGDVHVAQADQGSVWRKDKWLFANTAKIDGKKVQVPKSVAQWEQKPGPGGLWKKSIVDAHDAGQGGRRRGEEKAKDDKGPKDTYFAPAGQEKKPKPFYDILPGTIFESQEMKQLHIGKKFGGVMEWKLADSSTIGIIDRVFGLPYGADISGTTADELYFLTGCKDTNAGDPVVMMLPLAVIVGEYHHTLLEVAAAMSLRKVINYQIGFYETLLPPKRAGTELKQRVDIKQLLAQCETDPRNVHILLHYDRNGKIAGGFIAEGEKELDAFRKLGTVDMHLWPQFNSLPAYPPEDKIIGLLNGVRLGNEVMEARRKALRSQIADVGKLPKAA